MKWIISMMCAATFASILMAQNAKDLTTSECFVSASGEKLLYRLHKPENVPDGAKMPVILVFHGAGERGSNNVWTPNLWRQDGAHMALFPA